MQRVPFWKEGTYDFVTVLPEMAKKGWQIGALCGNWRICGTQILNTWNHIVICLEHRKVLKLSVLGALMLEQEILGFPNCEDHSEEIAQFFDHSDFTWNQSWRIWRLKICKFWFQWIFSLFEGWHLPNQQFLEPLR